jgi:hypothetical protein
MHILLLLKYSYKYCEQTVSVFILCVFNLKGLEEAIYVGHELATL